MKSMPNMLMVGATGRNLGKTGLLCRIIRQERGNRPVTGIKVTAFEGRPPPDKAYLNIPSDYLVTRECPADDDKDTHRMYRAGANHVYWLRCRRGCLAEGLDALFRTMAADGLDPDTGCLAAEAVCARRLVAPGLYLLIRDPRGPVKPSCAQTAHLADRLLNPRGEGWDEIIERLTFKDKRWSLL